MDVNTNSSAECKSALDAYEILVNQPSMPSEQLAGIIDTLILLDRDGKYCVSAVKYLIVNNIPQTDPLCIKLCDAAIDKDRERNYLPMLMESLFGSDYQNMAEEMLKQNDIFRRIYKRIYPTGI